MLKMGQREHTGCVASRAFFIGALNGWEWWVQSSQKPPLLFQDTVVVITAT